MAHKTLISLEMIPLFRLLLLRTMQTVRKSSLSPWTIEEAYGLCPYSGVAPVASFT